MTSADLKKTADELKRIAEELRAVTTLKSPEELRKATEYSVRGVRAVLFGEKAFRTDLVAFLACTAVASALRFYGFVSWCECAVMIYTVFMALVGEIINTAIEKTVDRISTDYNELSGRAKDIGSAIVFVSFFGAGIAWFVILLGVVARWWSSGHLLP